MAAAVTLLLIGCLLQDSVHGQYEATVPRNIEVLSGSCVTIPCSFTVENKLEWELGITCKAKWSTVQSTLVFDSSVPQQTNRIKGELLGDFTKKDCTTRLDNLQPEHSNKYFFRLECNKLKYSFSDKKFQTDISVKADPPRPTLTPSTVLVSEGTQVRLACSAPAPCQSNPPNLSWTSSLGDSKEKLQENQDKTKVKSVLTFTAHRRHHTKEIACTAVYNRQDGSIESSVSVEANVTFPPEILPSFVCTKATDQFLNCSCETVGNPLPTLQWYLDGQPVNQSDGFTVSNEPFNGTTGLRSIITLDRPQWRNISTLVCRSSNSLGSASGRFYVYRLEPQTCALNQDLSMSTVFIATVVALVCVILVIPACALLFIRVQKTHNSLATGAVTMSQLVTSEEGNEEPNTTEEDIYVNMQRQANVVRPAAISEADSTILPNSGPNNAEGVGKSSEDGGSDVVYTAVKWKSKSKRMNGKNSKRKALEGERCSYRNFVDNAVEMGNIYDEVRNSNTEGEGVYAQVKFKNKNALHK